MSKKSFLTLLNLILCSTLLTSLLSSRVEKNQIAIQLNRGLGDSRLTFKERMDLLTLLDQNESLQLEFKNIVEQEIVAYNQAIIFLKQGDYETMYKLGIQLLQNPEFNNGTINWTQYNSAWSLSSKPLQNDDFVISYSRQGEGHSSLSQTTSLPTGNCFLFMVHASVTREDAIPSNWLYWETYNKDNEPIGKHNVSIYGSQPWAMYADIFCLPKSSNEFEKVTVAPINIYGNATIHLGSSRLYLLSTVDQTS